MLNMAILIMKFVTATAISAILFLPTTTNAAEISCPHLPSNHDQLNAFMRPRKCARISNDEEDIDCRCHGVAQRLVWPYNLDDIKEHVKKEQTPLHIRRNDSLYYNQLFTSADFFRFTTFYRFKYEDGLIVVREGKTAFYSEEPAQLGDLLDSFSRNGSTIVMNNVHKRHEHIRAVSSAFEKVFTAFSSTNIYLTPAESRGFSFHQDMHIVFIMQLEGSKDWTIYRPSETRSFPWLANPSKDKDRRNRFFSEEELNFMEEFRVTLHPGDGLFIPRGVAHGAATSDTHSLHLTLSIDDMRKSWSFIMEHALLSLSARSMLSATSASSMQDYRMTASNNIVILRQSPLIHVDENGQISEEEISDHLPEWEEVVDAFQEFCEGHDQCSVNKPAFRRLRGRKGLECGLEIIRMMQCGGHLESLPDTASMGRLRVLTPEMQVYRRPEVHICALTDIVSDMDGMIVPQILGINRRWIFNFSMDDWQIAVEMQQLPVNVPFSIKDLPGPEPILTAQKYISHGVLALL